MYCRTFIVKQRRRAKKLYNGDVHMKQSIMSQYYLNKDCIVELNDQ